MFWSASFDDRWKLEKCVGFTKSRQVTPVGFTTKIFYQYKRTTGLWRVWSNLGGELDRSNVVSKLVAANEYVFETTASRSSFQNTQVARSHWTL